MAKPAAIEWKLPKEDPITEVTWRKTATAYWATLVVEREKPLPSWRRPYEQQQNRRQMREEEAVFGGLRRSSEAKMRSEGSMIERVTGDLPVPTAPAGGLGGAGRL